MWQTVDGLCGYVYYIKFRARALNTGTRHILREASSSLLVQLQWAFQSLQVWNEQRYSSHASFFYYDSL